MKHQYKTLESKYGRLYEKAQQNGVIQKEIAQRIPGASMLFADGMEGSEDLGMDITMKGQHFHIAQKDLAQSRVQGTSKPFAEGMRGDEDLGLDIVMKGEQYHIA